MTKDELPIEMPSWPDILVSLEARSPEELIAIMPGTGTEKLVEDFPLLGAVTFTDHEIPTTGDPVKVRAYDAAGGGSGIGFVWVHGGGFVFGHLDQDEAHWVALALAARGIAVVSVDYRKCLHGVHYPAPLNDVLGAWRWTNEHAVELGMTPGRIHLGGASAGGCLAAGVTKRVRDDEGPMPASCVLAYAVVHADLPEASAELREAMERAQVDGMFEDGSLGHNYAGSQAATRDPYAFASNGDVSGQPPVYILNSEADRLRASAESYGYQLEAAGVRVRMEFEPETVHGHLNEPYSAGGQRSIHRIVRWLSDPTFDVDLSSGVHQTT